MIQRELQNLVIRHLKKNKIIHIPGPRQVGKTTLLRELEKELPKPLLWLNGDETDVAALFEKPTSTKLRKQIGNNKLLIIDEAQRIPDIGIVLKLMKDTISGVHIIVTGSSAFDLANKINEPLTGRKTELFLFPFSFNELVKHTSLLEEKRLLENRLIYGYYPEVVTSTGEEKEVLKRLTDAYLYKDLFALEYIKKPGIIEKLLRALSLQVGNEVSFNELAQLVGADKETIEKYINYLEQAYVVFKLDSFSSNMRNEIRKGKKIYFYDNGIRNALIRNFSSLSLRNDTGALWENYLISERMKTLHYKEIWYNRYFWRTHAQQEIDYIEEYDGKLFAYEFKWKPKSKCKAPTSFVKAYPKAKFYCINKDNYIEFIKGEK